MGLALGEATASVGALDASDDLAAFGFLPLSAPGFVLAADDDGDAGGAVDADSDCCGAAGQSGIPIVVPMRFVGDTPMIMMTDHSLPGVGTFTVRVFFYGDRYAGTWQHGAAGGHMTGRIEKNAPSKPAR